MKKYISFMVLLATFGNIMGSGSPKSPKSPKRVTFSPEMPTRATSGSDASTGSFSVLSSARSFRDASLTVGTSKGDVFRNYYERTSPVAPAETVSSVQTAKQKQQSSFSLGAFCASSDPRFTELQEYVFGNYYSRAKK